MDSLSQLKHVWRECGAAVAAPPAQRLLAHSHIPTSPCYSQWPTRRQKIKKNKKKAGELNGDGFSEYLEGRAVHRRKTTVSNWAFCNIGKVPCDCLNNPWQRIPPFLFSGWLLSAACKRVHKQQKAKKKEKRGSLERMRAPAETRAGWEWRLLPLTHPCDSDVFSRQRWNRSSLACHASSTWVRDAVHYM